MTHAAPGRPAHNRLGLDYRQPPARRIARPIVDIHTHVRDLATARTFFECAQLYGIGRVYSMTGLAEVDALQAEFGDRIRFIAIPDWRSFSASDEFQRDWLQHLVAFHERGARICKFWVAPPMREKHGFTLEHAFLRPVIERALELEMDFMVHVADPSVWWRPGARYADLARFGSKAQQFDQLRWFLDFVRRRRVIAAHMAGHVEQPEFLEELLKGHPNLFLDCSATKWIVREVAARPADVREFLIRNSQRVLFGSDLVTGPDHDFDHYASRWWAHQMMWESSYDGESPIEDPDAPDPPHLVGLNLPLDVLENLYWSNAVRLGFEPADSN